MSVLPATAAFERARRRRGDGNHLAILLALILAVPSAAALASRSSSPNRGSIELAPCPVPGSSETMLCGVYEVPEDRAKAGGRTIELRLAVLPARKKNPRADPIFWIAGGPGDSAVGWASRYRTSWMRKARDLVLVDQRGTGESHPLLCDMPGSPSDLQGYVETYFGRNDVFRACKAELQKGANLRKYTTLAAVDDLEEVRQAMGYEQINLVGSSYGTRVGLIYMRTHPTRVRTALLKGLAPPSYTSPLYHSEGAQRAIDLVFGDCAREPACAGAFPDIADKFLTVLDRLEAEPAVVEVFHPDSGEPVSVSYPRTWFAEAVRLLLYRAENARWVPYLVQMAYDGAYQPLAQYVVDRRHARHLAGDTIGMLLSVTCPEDLARIDESRIPELTDGTFAGDERVRQQTAACKIWPKAKLPSNFGDPVVSEVPVLLWSGSQDPVTPPKWGDETSASLEDSLHLVVPAGHGIDGKCFDKVSRKFVKKASVRGLSRQGCLANLRLPPFVVPEGAAAGMR